MSSTDKFNVPAFAGCVFKFTDAKHHIRNFARANKSLEYDCAVSAAQFLGFISKDEAERERAVREDKPISSDIFCDWLNKKLNQDGSGFNYRFEIIKSAPFHFKNNVNDNTRFVSVLNQALQEDNLCLVCTKMHIFVACRLNGSLYLLDPQICDEPIIVSADNELYRKTMLNNNEVYFIGAHRNFSFKL